MRPNRLILNVRDWILDISGLYYKTFTNVNYAPVWAHLTVVIYDHNLAKAYIS
jgi:hypothetical protein